MKKTQYFAKKSDNKKANLQLYEDQSIFPFLCQPIEIINRL